MKEQHVGDVSDYRKYALLRALTIQGPTKLGVVWMLTHSDSTNDGQRSSYLQNAINQVFDLELFDILVRCKDLPDGQRLSFIEQSELFHQCTFFNDYLTDSLLERLSYFRRALKAVEGCDLVFFDPDNGIDVPSRGKGGRYSSKYLFRDELFAAFAQGASVLVYQHFPRSERVGFMERVAREVASLCSNASVWCFTTPHVLFVLAVAPTHIETIGAAAGTISSKWPSSFIRALSPSG